VEDAVQSLVSHLLSSSSSLPLKRLAAPSLASSTPVTTSNVFLPKSTVTTRPQGSNASSNAQLIRVIRRPNTAEPISCPAVSSNHVQPVIFNVPLATHPSGGAGGLLIVPETPSVQAQTVTVSLSQPTAVAHGWTQFMPPQPPPSTATNHAPPHSGNFLLETPHVGSKLAAAPVNVYQPSLDNKMNSSKQTLDNSPFDIAGFSTAAAVDSVDKLDIVDESESKSSTLPCDVLEDLLHIVNESLGPQHTDTPTLPDYDLAALDDDNSLISMVVSPNSEVPASTGKDDSMPLAKIMDYCPEWSYVEVTVMLLCTLLNAYTHLCNTKGRPTLPIIVGWLTILVVILSLFLVA